MTQPNNPQEQIDRGTVSRAQLLVIGTALVLNMLDGFDVSALAFTAHRIGEEMHISPGQLGIVFSAALAGMMAGAMFLAPLADIYGRRRTIIIAVSGIGVSMLLVAASTALWQLVLIRFITGLGVGVMLASLATSSAEYTPEKYRSLAVVIITSGYPLGSTIGGFMAAPLLANYGWQSVYLLAGSISLLLLLPVFWWIPESLDYLCRKRSSNALVRINGILAGMDKQVIAELPPITAARPQKANVLSLLTPTHRYQTITLWLSVFFCLISMYFLLSWIPKLVVNAGLSESMGVYASAAFTAGSTLGTVALGLLAARFGLSLMITVFLSTSAAWMVVFALNSHAMNLLWSLFGLGFLFTSGYSGLYAVAARIYPAEIRATGVGWAIGLGRMGAVVGPYTGGLLIAAGISLEVNFMIFAVPILLGGIMAWRIRVH